MPNDVTNTNAAILTLDSDAVLETAQSKADLIWHDIQNAYRTRKILTGTLGGIEKTEAGNLIAVYLLQRISGCHSNHRNDDQPPSR